MNCELRVLACPFDRAICILPSATTQLREETSQGSDLVLFFEAPI